MDETEILRKAMRKERDVEVWTRIMAVRFVLLGNSVASAALMTNRPEDMVRSWIERFQRDGIRGLRAPAGERDAGQSR